MVDHCIKALVSKHGDAFGHLGLVYGRSAQEMFEVQFDSALRGNGMEKV